MKNVKVNGKWDILLPDHRAARPQWYTPKGWERERLDSMSENLGPEDVLYYIGAEEGDMAGLCALWGAKIALFEPNDKVWPNIKAIWEANKLPAPIFTFCGFASNYTSPYLFQPRRLSDLDWPASSLGEVIGDHGFKELSDPGTIPQLKIDDLDPEISWAEDIKPPTAISIDVEGSEWEVLKGAEETLKKYRPKLWVSIHPEFMFRLYGQYQADLRKWIRDIGYQETFLAYDHEMHLFYEPIKNENNYI